MAVTRGVVSIQKLQRAYAADYAGWIEDTARAIEDGRFSEIDRVALADEVRDLGKTERRELRSALEVLIMHMLKTRYQPSKQTRSWDLTMRVQRNHITQFLKESPSLRRELPELIKTAYENARLRAADETGLALDTFPESCELAVSEILAMPAKGAAAKPTRATSTRRKAEIE